MHTNDYVHLWSTLGAFSSNPMGVQWTGIVFGLGGAIACGYWTTDFLVVQRAMAAKDLRSAGWQKTAGPLTARGRTFCW